MQDSSSSGVQLQRAVFLRGVSDPTEVARITTVFYRPKHVDLRYQDGFVKAGPVNVPLSNVVEMLTILGNHIERQEIPAPPVELEEPKPESKPSEEAKPFRRRGRPRKNAS